MDKQLQKVLRQQVKVEPVISVNGRGDISYGTPVYINCYIAGENKMVRNIQGEEEVSTISLFISTANISIDHKDRITLPDGRQPPIIAITPYIDELGKLYSVEVAL